MKIQKLISGGVLITAGRAGVGGGGGGRGVGFSCQTSKRGGPFIRDLRVSNDGTLIWMLQFKDGLYYDGLSGAASVFMNTSIYRWIPLWFSFGCRISFYECFNSQMDSIMIFFQVLHQFYECFNLQMDPIMTFFQVSHQFLWIL